MNSDNLAILNQKLDYFEKCTEWRFSREARAILELAFVSLSKEYLGLGDYTNDDNRSKLINQVLDNIDDFLLEIAKSANNEVKNKNLESNDERLTDAIYIMQHFDYFKMSFDCLCWPR